MSTIGQTVIRWTSECDCVMLMTKIFIFLSIYDLFFYFPTCMSSYPHCIPPYLPSLFLTFPIYVFIHSQLSSGS